MDAIIRTVKEFILDNFLQGEKPEALTPDMPLITTGILDSLATLELVSFLETHYDIQLEAHELDPGRIGSLNAIARLVQSKLPAGA